jgi:hypothetical protein
VKDQLVIIHESHCIVWSNRGDGVVEDSPKVIARPFFRCTMEVIMKRYIEERRLTGRVSKCLLKRE